MKYVYGKALTVLLACLYFLLVTSCAAPVTDPVPAAPSAPVIIRINNSVEYQTMEGFGATTRAAVMLTGNGLRDMLEPDLRRRAIEAVYGEAGLTMGNLELWYEPVNDDDDPFHFNWSAFRWEVLDSMYKLLVLPARDHGFDNFALSLKINTRYALKWLQEIRAIDYKLYLDEIAEYVAAGASFWRAETGTVPKYIFLFNEPLSGNRELSSGTAQEIIDIIKAAGDRLRKEGFDEVLFVVPNEETVEKSIETANVILQDEKARGYVGAIAYHAYPYRTSYSSIKQILQTSGSGQPVRREILLRDNLKTLGEKYGLPVWMTEITEGPGNADFAFGAPENLRARAIHIHDEVTYANASAYFGMNNLWDRRTHEAHFKDRNVPFSSQTSSIALVDQEQPAVYITGMGYAIGHYARWIRRGAIRIDVSSTEPLIKVCTFRDKLENKLIMIIINNFDTEKHISVKLDDARITAPVEGELSDDRRRWDRIDSIKSDSGNTFRILASARSVITLSIPVQIPGPE